MQLVALERSGSNDSENTENSPRYSIPSSRERIQQRLDSIHTDESESEDSAQTDVAETTSEYLALYAMLQILDSGIPESFLQKVNETLGGITHVEADKLLTQVKADKDLASVNPVLSAILKEKSSSSERICLTKKVNRKFCDVSMLVSDTLKYVDAANAPRKIPIQPSPGAVN